MGTCCICNFASKLPRRHVPAGQKVFKELTCHCQGRFSRNQMIYSNYSAGERHKNIIRTLYLIFTLQIPPEQNSSSNLLIKSKERGHLFFHSPLMQYMSAHSSKMTPSVLLFNDDLEGFCSVCRRKVLTES